MTTLLNPKQQEAVESAVTKSFGKHAMGNDLIVEKTGTPAENAATVTINVVIDDSQIRAYLNSPDGQKQLVKVIRTLNKNKEI